MYLYQYPNAIVQVHDLDSQHALLVKNLHCSHPVKSLISLESLVTIKVFNTYGVTFNDAQIIKQYFIGMLAVI